MTSQQGIQPLSTWSMIRLTANIIPKAIVFDPTMKELILSTGSVGPCGTGDGL